MEELTEKPGSLQNREAGYRVLALKYRPRVFDDLVGQEAMVRTLRAAFSTGRVAHAFMLTGVRGVGKTSTARLLARAFNYTDAEGNSTPSVDFGAPGKNCEAIAEGNHMDVLEMDAASRTGIEDIREIIDSAKFKPAIAAYKVYIIDEVHMLSKSAFNGLLKILEEPPPHVKFIFATTEIRKVPVTILSRCQRFDLRRIDTDRMIPHIKSICEKEQVKVEDAALALIARAAEGSVRDALSLLDQAIAQGSATGDSITQDLVRDMLGLADRERVLDLLDLLFQGKAADALDELKAQHDLGADPLEVLRDLLDLVNWLTRVKLVGDAAVDAAISETQGTRGRAMAARLDLNILSRAWQMLLKGLAEAQAAPRPMAAVEMVLVRLAYAANLPPPDELIRKLQKNDGATRSPGMTRNSKPLPPSAPAAPQASQDASVSLPPSRPESGESGSPQTTAAQGQKDEDDEPDYLDNPENYDIPADWEPDVDLQEESALPPELLTFHDLVAFVGQKRDLRLLHEIEDFVHLVRFEQERIEFRPAGNAPEGLAGRLSQSLEKWTGRRWVVSVSNSPGEPTLAESRKDDLKKLEARMRADPLVQAVFAQFPDANVVDVRRGPEDPGTDSEGLDAAPPNADKGRYNS